MPGSTDADFTRAFVGAMAYRAVLGLGVMAGAFAAGNLAMLIGGEWAPVIGAALGGLAGYSVVVRIQRARRRRQTPVATGRDPSATHSLHEPG